MRVNRGLVSVALALLVVLPGTGALLAQQGGPRKSIGVMLQGDESGIRVANVVPGSPAEKGGVKAGDKVMSIGGVMVEELDPDKMKAIMDTAKVIAMVVTRDGKSMTFQLTPVMLTPPPMPPSPSGGGQPKS